jgi:hypothetical protein
VIFNVVKPERKRFSLDLYSDASCHFKQFVALYQMYEYSALVRTGMLVFFVQPFFDAILVLLAVLESRDGLSTGQTDCLGSQTAKECQ